MEAPIIPVRPARRKEPKAASEPKTKTIAVSDLAFNHLEKNAKKFKMNKSKYTSAAITFFAEAGLNPVDERAAGLAAVELKVSQQTRRVLEQNADFTNRLIAIIRGWEKSSYGFHQQQHMGLVNYLEQIETKILDRMVGQEVNLFAPMIQELLKTNIEAFVNRSLSTKLYLRAIDGNEVRFDPINASAEKERDRELAEQLVNYHKEHPLPNLTNTPKPAVTPVPAKIVAVPSIPVKTETSEIK